jgi:integrase
MSQIKMRPAVYANHKRKDGTYPIKIVVYFKGKERKLPTHIVAEAKDLTRSLHLKQGEKLSAAQDLIIKMQNACIDIPYFDLEHRDVDFVVSYIKGKLSKEDFHLDFFLFADEWLNKKSAAKSTKAGYIQSLNAFGRYLGKRECDVNQITHAMVQEFMAFINNEPRMHHDKATGKLIKSEAAKSTGQAPRHVIKLSRIYDEAKRKYNDEDSGKVLIPRSPFSNHDLSTPAPQGQKPLTKDVIQRLISAKESSSMVRSAIDAAVVSFGLMGINLADLYEVAEPKGGVLVYYRKKTRGRRADKAEMRIDVPACLTPYIERLKGKSKGVWLGRLQEMCANPDHITGIVNRGLAKWCEQEGVEAFTFYAIRKSWATLARKAGVEKALVDEGLAHVGDYKMTDIYAERPWDKINEANSKVLELFDWN